MPKTDIRASAQQQTLTWKLHSQALIAPAFTLVIFIGVLPSFFSRAFAIRVVVLFVIFARVQHQTGTLMRMTNIPRA